MIGVVDFPPTPPFHVPKRGTGIFIPACIVPKDPSGRVGHPGKLGNAIGKSTKSLFTFPMLFFDIFLGGEVQHQTDIPQIFPVRCKAGRGGVQNRVIRTIRTPKTVFQSKRLSFSVRFPKRLLNGWAVVRVNRRQPSLTETGCLYLPGKVVPGLTEKDTVPVCIRNPGHDLRMMSQMLEA